MIPSRHRLLPLAALLPALLHAGAAQAKETLRVEIEGLRGDLRRNVLATLSLEQSKGDKNLTEARIRQLHDRALGEIEDALQPFGYYHPVVQSKLEHEGSAWVARYTVDPGPVLRLTSRDLQVTGAGAEDPGFEALVRSFPLKEGDTLFQPAYEQGKKALTDYAAENGYLDAAFDAHELRVDLDTYTSRMVLHFSTGPRYLFGPVNFNQNFLRPELLKGYVTFRRGDPLDASELLQLQRALADSPYFRRVEVVTRQELARNLEVPIEVDLTPSKRQRWNGGVGYGTDTGPRASVALELRRINRRGHRAQMETRVSQIEKSFQGSYQVPGAYPRTDVWTYSVGYANLTPKTSQSRKFLLGTGLTETRGSWREAFSLNFNRETFTVGVDKGISRLLTPQTSWSRVKADDRIYTTNGHKVQFDLRGADRSLLSNASFLQAEAQGKLIHSFAGHFRLVTRADAGYTETRDFRILPPTVRFFAGGDQSVRGYAYHALGEHDEAGNVIGGTVLTTASVEVEYLFLRDWKFLQKLGVATFYDTGNALQSFSGPYKSGAGIGLRWLSPIGPIRADAAWALSQPGHPIRFHLSVGPDL
jgi:translocation and assembly module TamA